MGLCVHMPPRRKLQRAASNAGDVGRLQNQLILDLELLYSELKLSKKNVQEPLHPPSPHLASTA